MPECAVVTPASVAGASLGGRVSLFSKNDEFVNLLLPFLILPLSVLEITYFPVLASGPVVLWGQIIAQMILLNITHNAFTFAFLATVPEAKEWVRAVGNGRPEVFWVKTAALFAATFSAFFLLQWPYNNVVTGTVMDKLFMVVWVFLPTHHAMKQTQGFCFLYDHAALKTLPAGSFDPQKIRSYQSLDRLCFALLLGTSFTWRVLRNQLHPQPLLLIVLASAGFAAVVGVLGWNLRRYPGAGRSNKLFYCGRLLLLPLAPFSVVAMLGLQACHGVEYLMIYRRMVQRSSLGGFTSAPIIIWTIVTAAIMCYPSMYRYDIFLSATQAITPGAIALTSISFAISVTHYHLDRLLFAMKDPLSRKLCSELLFDPAPAR